MHVAHIVTPFATQGSSIAHVVRALTREAVRAGDSPLVVTSDNRDAHFPDAEVVPVDYRRFCPREYFTRPELAFDALLGCLLMERPHGARIYRPAVEAVRRAQPDWVVLHEGQYASTALPALRAALPAAGIALHIHNTVSRSCLPHELTAQFAHADLVVAVSHSMARSVARRSIRQAHKIHTVHNGVDLERFHPDNRVPAPDQMRLLFMGQVAPHKGVDILMRALAKLGTAAERYQVRVVGSGHHDHATGVTLYERHLRATAGEISGQVEFIPYVPQEEAAQYYRWADVVAVPSRREAFGMVAMEALASGKLVIASDVGGLPEALGGVGMTLPLDVDVWARTLGSLSHLRAAEERDAALQRARELAWPRVYARLRGLMAEARNQVSGL